MPFTSAAAAHAPPLPPASNLADCSDSRMERHVRRVLRRHSIVDQADAASSSSSSRRRHRITDLGRVLVSYFIPTKLHLRRLRRTKNATETAVYRRAVAHLHSSQTKSASAVASSISTATSSTSPQRFMAVDCLHHVLWLQAQWLGAVLDVTAASNDHHGLTRLPLQHFLQQFVDENGAPHVPGAPTDSPSMVLARFEELIAIQHLLPIRTRRSFDRICIDTMLAMPTPPEEIWKHQRECAVLQALVTELTEIIRQAADLPAVEQVLLQVLREFVEQMVCSRLVAVAYVSSYHQMMNQRWQRKRDKCRKQSWHTLGRGLHLNDWLGRLEQAGDTAFAATIAALDELPYLVPSAMLRAVNKTLQMLRVETRMVLGVSLRSVTQDVLLALLLYVLSRCRLPYICSQLLVLQQFVEDGTKSAYFVVALSGAVMHLLKSK